MGDSKKAFKFTFKKKDKKNSGEFKSPMFKSPSHYWTASQTDFLHSKGSANVELSIDPFNKSLIRIFCQSIDKMVNYKSIEYNSRTIVQQVIEKIIKILRINKSVDQFVLVETVGRCLLLAKDGSTTKVVAKSGQPFIYIEQNRRTLMNADYVLTVLNYWKPMFGFSRRFELCLAEKNHQMTSCDGETSRSNSFLSPYYDTHDSSSTKSGLEVESKYTQTETSVAPPVAPRRRQSMRTVKHPHLLTLKGDDTDDQNFVSFICSSLEFGSPGSSAGVILNNFSKFPNQKICIFSRTNSDDSDSQNQIYLSNYCSIPDLSITVNGCEVVDRMALQPGDIIGIGQNYSYFFKDPSNDKISIKHFPNATVSNNMYDASDQAVTSSSISSCSDVNNSMRSGSRIIKIRKKVSIDLHGISLACFDTALNQIIIHYFDGRMNLTNAVVFTLYLIRFCRESTRCSFSLDEMQARIKKRFCKSLQVAHENNYYLLGNLKLTSFAFQLWLVYNNENYIEATEENRLWLDFLESFTTDIFDHLSSYICESAQNLSTCFFEESPFVNFDEQIKFREDGDTNTMEKFLKFLNDIYENISKIGCDKMSEILKTVFTSRIVIFITESTVIHILSDMKNFNWNKGVQISTQVEKFENWLGTESVTNVFESDGFLQDFSKLISTRISLLKQMNWRTIRQNYSKIPLVVLNQFLLGLASENVRILSLWQIPPNEISESNKDVMDVLSDYLRSASNHTLFQPGIILQTDCVPIDKFIHSIDFISICTVLDTELIAMGENFQWMSLPKPQSLINFKNRKWVALRDSIGEEKLDLFKMNSPKGLPSKSNTKSLKKMMQADSDYSSSSNKGDQTSSSKKIIARYMQLKNNLNNHSKSMVSLIEPDGVPKPPIRRKNKGSFSNLSNPSHINYKTQFISVNDSRSREGFSNKSCYSRIGRSESLISDTNIDTNDRSGINDVDQSIEEMEREIQNSDSCNAVDRFLNPRSASPSFDNEFDEDDDDMSIGLSAAGLTNRLKAFSKSSDHIIDVDDKKQMEITLSKSAGESYGITLADGTQTNLKRDGIYIYKITNSSPAFKNGQMKPGDRIIAINNYTVDELNFQECLMLITKSLKSVKLLIEKSDLKTTLSIMSVYQ